MKVPFRPRDTTGFDPDSGVLTGLENIRRYLKVKNHKDLKEWIELGLPVVQLPDGRWITSIQAIDTYIIQTAVMQHQQRNEPGQHRWWLNH